MIEKIVDWNVMHQRKQTKTKLYCAEILVYVLSILLRPNKKISVLQVTGLKILGRVGTHIFFS